MGEMQVVGQSSRSHGRQRATARDDSRGDKATARLPRQVRSTPGRWGSSASSSAVDERGECSDNNVVDFPTSSATSIPAATPPLAGFAFFLVWLLRLAILGAGLGAIIGTILAIVEPQEPQIGRRAVSGAPIEAEAEITAEATPGEALPALQPTHKLASLHEQFVTLAAAQPQLVPGAYLIDLNTGEYLNLRGGESFPAAGTIKFPILVALFQAVEAGTVTPDERLTLRSDLVSGGFGSLQYQPPNSTHSVLEVAEKMAIESDNTATNLLIDRLGGAADLNRQFQEWGLEQTTIRNLLPDLAGTNETSPQDLVKLMAMLDRGRLVGRESQEQILGMMQRAQAQPLLARGLGEGATIAHKTGDIGAMLGDVGAIELPSGKRYLAAVLVGRPHNDRSAQELIRAYSQAAYRHFVSAPPRTGEFTAPTTPNATAPQTVDPPAP